MHNIGGCTAAVLICVIWQVLTLIYYKITWFFSWFCCFWVILCDFHCFFTMYVCMAVQLSPYLILSYTAVFIIRLETCQNFEKFCSSNKNTSKVIFLPKKNISKNIRLVSKTETFKNLLRMVWQQSESLQPNLQRATKKPPKKLCLP